MILFLGNKESLPVYEKFIRETRDTSPDIVVSCQYPFKIPNSIIDKFICVNIHYGKLPEYAGCFPVYWQIMNKEEYAGVTLHYVVDRWDAGDIINIGYVRIGEKTADELYDELAVEGFNLLRKHFEDILTEKLTATKQDLSKRRYYSADMVDFNREKYLESFDGTKIRALHFKGKPYPIIKIGSRYFEVVKAPC